MSVERTETCVSSLELAHLEPVLVQVPFLREGAVAARADVVLAVGVVDKQVRAQVRLVGECALASRMWASVWTLACTVPIKSIKNKAVVDIRL